MIQLVSIILLSTTLLLAQSKHQKLNSSAKSVENHPALKHGFWGFYAANSETSEILIDINGEKGLTPASNQKLVTTAAALSLLGSTDTLHTYVEYSGTVSDGILKGDLYIRGEADPTLGSCSFDSTTCRENQLEKWVSAVKKSGITEIQGNIIGDDTFLDHMPLSGAWQWTDIGNYYATSTSGLTFNENLYYLFFKPARYVGGPAIVIGTNPEIPGLTFFNHMKTGPKGSGDKGFIYAAPWQNLHQLEGTIPAGVREFSIKGAMPDPASFTAHSLKENLEKSGITVNGESLSIRNYDRKNNSRQVINVTNSPSLAEIVYILNKKSNNLYAEQLLKILGKKIGGEGSFNKGIEIVENWLEDKGISTEGIFIHDGSGLSMLNRLSPKFLVNLLLVMKKQPEFESFYNSLPIAGDSKDIGTLKKFCRNTRAANNVRAKTGSHVRVRALSGYVKSKSGQMICFSMIANDYTGSSRVINNLHEKVMVQLAEIQ